jgi:hypothetical protein
MQSMTLAMKQNWFWPVAVVLFGLTWAIMLVSRPETSAGLELALLFDVLATIPVLFALCYAHVMPLGRLAIRIVALQCLGIWVAAKILPIESQVILLELRWLRNLGLAVLFVIELRLAIALLRLVFRAETKEADLQELGMPPLMAKLALAEARFWRWVVSAFRK